MLVVRTCGRLYVGWGFGRSGRRRGLWSDGWGRARVCSGLMVGEGLVASLIGLEGRLKRHVHVRWLAKRRLTPLA